MQVETHLWGWLHTENQGFDQSIVSTGLFEVQFPLLLPLSSFVRQFQICSCLDPWVTFTKRKFNLAGHFSVVHSEISLIQPSLLPCREGGNVWRPFYDWLQPCTTRIFLKFYRIKEFYSIPEKKKQIYIYIKKRDLSVIVQILSRVSVFGKPNFSLIIELI